MGIGAAMLILSIALAPAAARDAAAHTWSPFVLVTGLLLIGVTANQDGVFAAAARWLGQIARGPTQLYLSAMALTAVVTVLLNLDTAVAFLTPVLVHAARRARAGELRFLYGCVFMANAASLLLPGSNLTNLLVLSQEHTTGSVFLARMVAPWTASVLVTLVIVGLAFPSRSDDGEDPDERIRAVQPLSLVAVAIAILLVLVLADAALPVLAVGSWVTAARLVQRRIRPAQVRDGVDAVSLLGVFLIAVALGTLARTWTFPGDLMAHASEVASAAIGALAAVLVNNLPAAVLLASRVPAHPRALLFGLNIGPNLAVTGSLSALIWWQAARSVGARPSARRYSMVGVVLVPLTLAATLAAAHLTG